MTCDGDAGKSAGVLETVEAVASQKKLRQNAFCQAMWMSVHIHHEAKLTTISYVHVAVVHCARCYALPISGLLLSASFGLAIWCFLRKMYLKRDILKHRRGRGNTSGDICDTPGHWDESCLIAVPLNKWVCSHNMP